jgi:hypothetical protein
MTPRGRGAPGRALQAGALVASVACALALLPGPRAAAAAEPPAAEPAHLYTAVPGDTLIGLGRRFLVEPSRWPALARANALRDPDHIAAGTVLRIPLGLMRTEAVAAEVIGVVGQVQAGQTVPEGGEVSTGADGHATLRLVDGTLLRLRPGSRLHLSESRRLRDAPGVRSGVRLEQGRVEIEAAPAPAGRPGFKIDTPQGVLAVRGTEFRVAADAAEAVTRGEVLGGTVVFTGRADGAAEPVPSGYGAVIGAGGQVAPPVRLLQRPDTAALPALQERLLMRFALAPIVGAAAYRGQIARDASFDQVVADLTTATPELRFAELPDGDYVLRVRGIDAQGLEGEDADHRFRLKARPEPPLPSAPAPGAVIYGGRVEFAWAANPQAQGYRLQLGTEAGFAAPLRDLDELRSLSTVLEGLPPGRYQWRLASVRGGADRGPWGVPRSFELRPLPPQPKPPTVGDRSIGFSWEGAPGQTFEFQLARDAAFTRIVLERTLDTPGVELPLPGSGRFHMRLRARDADGFVGPYTTPQYFDVPNCLRIAGSCVRAGNQTLNLAP